MLFVFRCRNWCCYSAWVNTTNRCTSTYFYLLAHSFLHFYYSLGLKQIIPSNHLFKFTRAVNTSRVNNLSLYKVWWTASMCCDMHSPVLSLFLHWKIIGTKCANERKPFFILFSFFLHNLYHFYFFGLKWFLLQWLNRLQANHYGCNLSQLDLNINQKIQ